ncbi:hypothetical protein LTR85_003776 [Meristemomyces frigidus]|nr:hypothetical protein LTR85_003776 [Meristemomyces frigidus]
MAENRRQTLERSAECEYNSFHHVNAEVHIPPERERNQKAFSPELTAREHKLAKFCEAYTDVSFATISAGAPAMPGVAIVAGREDTRAEATPVPPHPELLGLELSSPIERGLLKHKIDAVEERLAGRRESTWLAILADALKAAAEIGWDLLLRLHKVNVVIAGLEVSGRAESTVDARKKRINSAA